MTAARLLSSLPVHCSSFKAGSKMSPVPSEQIARLVFVFFYPIELKGVMCLV